ncbi:MAG TPA: amino acid racemase [Vicinamibacteria bacterium]|nr:amino acid racemase [Vicinamibacteria bacterium]
MITKPTWKHVIGILGGLGPHAHVEFEALLLRATEQALGRSARDQDYPPWVLSSMPATPDRTRAILEGTESPVEALVESARRLVGAAFAVIPCNTAHVFLPQVRPRVSIPFLDMVREAVEKALARVGPRGSIGVLAASGTIRSGIYAETIRRIAPESRMLTPFDLEGGEQMQEKLVMEPIYGALCNGNRAGGGIKSGGYRDPLSREKLAEPMREAARRLSRAGADVVLTACTEIPLVLGRDRVDEVRLLDPMWVAAEAAVEIALGNRPLPS